MGPASAWMAGPANGPEARITATPARPGALASAKMLESMEGYRPSFLTMAAAPSHIAFWNF